MPDDEFACGLCNPEEQDVLVGETHEGEEIQASTEEEQAEAVASLPTPS